MKTLVLKNNFQMNMTMLPNSFVDHFLDRSNIGLEISSPPC